MTIDSSSKKFIVSGCSFSTPPSWPDRSWPISFMAHLPDYTLINKSAMSRGNGLISRAVIYEVQNQLQNGVLPEDILVAVQWSGWDRHENHISDLSLLPSSDEQVRPISKRVQGFITGPCARNQWIQGFVDSNINPDGDLAYTLDGTGVDVVIQDSGNYINSWEIMNHHWGTKNSKLYYSSMLYSDTGKLIESLEHILRTQWFLEKHNIKYFMTTMIKFPDSCDETEHLFQMIDKSKFLPVSGMFEWAQSTGLPLRDDDHPSFEQNRIFADTVVLPFLINTVI